MAKASIHIEEDENGNVNIWCDIDPEMTPEMADGRTEMPFPHYAAGLILDALSQLMEAGMPEEITREGNLGERNVGAS